MDDRRLPVGRARAFAGKVSRPWISVETEYPDSNDARSGIVMPACSRPRESRYPPMISGTWSPVRITYSMAANFSGWSWYTARATVSPTTSCTGAAIAPTLNAMRNPSRW